MTLRKSLIMGIIGAASFISICTANAADITYDVNQTIGTGGVTGIIETDGTIGVLSASNILNWNLAVNANPQGAFDLVGPGPGNGILVGGGDLSATATQLLFDFSGADKGFVVIGNDNIQNLLFLSPDSGFGFIVSGEVIQTGEFSGFGTDLSGTQVIATTANGPSVPEPGSVLLLSGGLLGLGLLRLRRR